MQIIFHLQKSLVSSSASLQDCGTATRIHKKKALLRESVIHIQAYRHKWQWQDVQ